MWYLYIFFFSFFFRASSFVVLLLTLSANLSNFLSVDFFSHSLLFLLFYCKKCCAQCSFMSSFFNILIPVDIFSVVLKFFPVFFIFPSCRVSINKHIPSSFIDPSTFLLYINLHLSICLPLSIYPSIYSALVFFINPFIFFSLICICLSMYIYLSIYLLLHSTRRLCYIYFLFFIFSRPFLFLPAPLRYSLRRGVCSYLYIYRHLSIYICLSIYLMFPNIIPICFLSFFILFFCLQFPFLLSPRQYFIYLLISIYPCLSI